MSGRFYTLCRGGGREGQGNLKPFFARSPPSPHQATHLGQAVNIVNEMIDWRLSKDIAAGTSYMTIDEDVVPEQVKAKVRPPPAQILIDQKKRERRSGSGPTGSFRQGPWAILVHSRSRSRPR